MLGRALWGLGGWFFVTSGLLLMWLTFLGGVRNSNPANIIYFLEADTSAIPGAPASSRWTFWNLCAVTPDGKSDCGENYPDFPFDPPSHRNFNTTVNVPPRFIDTNHYFLMSRFMFPFMIIALFFAVLAFFSGFASMCISIGGWVSALLTFLGLGFQTLVTTIMTALYVQGRSAFSANGQTAKLGVKAFAFMWTATALLFLSMVCYVIGAVVSKDDNGYSGREQRRRGFFSSNRSSSMRSNKETNV